MDIKRLINKFEELYSPQVKLSEYVGMTAAEIATMIRTLNPNEPEADEMAIAIGAYAPFVAVAGRPTYYGEAMRQTAVWLPENMIAWLKSQGGGGMGEIIRKLIQQAMDAPPK